MRFTTAAISSPGGRPYNEDAWSSEQVDANAGCWVVADGLGGHGGGEVASRIAVEQVLAAFRRDATLAPETLQGYLEAAQTAILNGQKTARRLSGMRTTIVILLSDFHAALWSHVGDSRLYHFRAGRVSSQTRDHSVPQALVDAGLIPPEAVRSHEDRNRLLRSLGNVDNLQPTIAEQPLMLEEKDAFLLCTDGFWEYVLETEMETDLAKAQEPEGWLGRMEARLQGRALAWHDNYSAVAVLVQAE